MRINDNSGESHGLMFRHQDGNSFYSYRISQNGHYSFDIHQSEKYKHIIGHTPSNAILKGRGQMNCLRVIAKKSEFELFINGIKVASINDSSFKKGAVGLMACTCCEGASYINVSFSNFAVTSN